MSDRLDEAQIAARLAKIPGWTRNGNEISRTVAAQTFLDSVEGIVVKVAHAAEEAGHHPDIDIRWRNVTFSLTTHDAGNALTALDFDLAEKIDRIAKDFDA